MTADFVDITLSQRGGVSVEAVVVPTSFGSAGLKCAEVESGVHFLLANRAM